MMHSGRELLRLLEDNGFNIVSIKGSHYKMRHKDGRWLTLPFCDRQYPKGTYFNILRLAGLRPSDKSRKDEKPKSKSVSDNG
jgi:predicted RNA binding protein YcfA (HicA-like mRNA interferase family)